MGRPLLTRCRLLDSLRAPDKHKVAVVEALILRDAHRVTHERRGGEINGTHEPTITHTSQQRSGERPHHAERTTIMTTMQTDQSIKLIFKDQAGDYFLVPRELMEQCRVPAEQKAEVDRALAEGTPIDGVGADDTEAFVLPLVPIVFLAGVAAGGAAGITGAAIGVYIATR